MRTLGAHLRRWRLELGLLQREVAERLGVDPSTVTNWELSRTAPALRFLPGILHLIGFDPSPPAGASLGERLKAYRRHAGISQQQFARLLGIDPGTLSRWERNLRVPTGRSARLMLAFQATFDCKGSVPPGLAGQPAELVHDVADPALAFDPAREDSL